MEEVDDPREKMESNEVRLEAEEEEEEREEREGRSALRSAARMWSSSASEGERCQWCEGVARHGIFRTCLLDALNLWRLGAVAPETRSPALTLAFPSARRGL